MALEIPGFIKNFHCIDDEEVVVVRLAGIRFMNGGCIDGPMEGVEKRLKIFIIHILRNIFLTFIANISFIIAAFYCY